MLLEVKMTINVNDPNLTITKVEDLLEDFVYEGISGEFIKGEITKVHDGGWGEKDNTITITTNANPFPLIPRDRLER